MHVDVGVVGAGIVGLSTAINIQKLIHMSRVTIIADNFGVETITPVTPPIYLPIPSRIMGVDLATAKEWLTDSWRHHYAMAKSPEGRQSGQNFMSGYALWSTLPKGETLIQSDLVLDYKPLSELEMWKHNFNYQNGAKFTTIAIEISKYLPWLMKEFRQRGGRVVCNTVYAMQELYGKYDIAVNCTGRRARELVHDPYLEPLKGHVALIDHEWHKKFLITEDYMSIVPSMETNLVSVGHMLAQHVYERYLDDDTMELMLNKIKALAPHLVGGEVVKKYAERTPFRSPPLLRSDLVDCGGPILPVVQNVGLGTEAVTLAWGTGAHAAHLVQDVRRLILPYCKFTR